MKKGLTWKKVVRVIIVFNSIIKIPYFGTLFSMWFIHVFMHFLSPSCGYHILFSPFYGLIPIKTLWLGKGQN